MSQIRYGNYADPITMPDLVSGRYAHTTKGIYRGFDMGVDASGNITLAAGYGVQHNGIAWQEDDTRTLSFTPPGAATTYTVYATHTDVQMRGGSPVEYVVQSGELTDVVGGVIIGWVYHPGGGVPLAVDHMLEAPKMLTSNYAAIQAASQPIGLSAPFPRTYSDVAGMGANVVFQGQDASTVQFDAANYVVYQSAAKAAGPVVLETLVQHVQFYATAWRPFAFDLYVDVIGATASLIVQLRDTDLNIVTISGSPITSTGGWAVRTITVDRTSGTFTDGQPYTLRLTSSVSVGEEIRLARIVQRHWPYPG